MSANSTRPRSAASRSWVSGLLAAYVVLILIRAAPLIQKYVIKLLSRHSLLVFLAAGLGALCGLLLLALAIARWPRGSFVLLGAGALLLILLSGNLAALFVAGAILALTLLAGDTVSRLLRGREASEGDLSGVFAAGAVTMGVVVLLLGEVGLLRPPGVLALAAVLLLARGRRVAGLARWLYRSLAIPRGTSPRFLEALWLAAAILLIGAEWVGSLGPDLSPDALAYHLPEALQTARAGRVDYLIDLVPQTYFWRNHETFLSLGFLFQGERAVHFLQFAVGLGAFAAALALARRLQPEASRPLILLALASFPMADLQLRATYVDWPAAFLVTAAAAEIAAAKQDQGRLRLAGFLLGGAIATKVFAILGAPALAILLLRRGGWHWRRIAALAAGVLIALLPWFAWSHSRGGFFLAPYVKSASSVAAAPSEADSGNAPPVERGRHPTSLPGFLRIPYDLTYHSNHSEGNQTGYNGLIPLAILPGILGWGALGLLFYLAASLAAMVPWYLLYQPSIRYLIPIYPLYAIFAVEGLRRATRDFAGRLGTLAGCSLAVAAIGIPTPFLTSRFDFKVALGTLSWDQALTTRLPEYPLFRHLSVEDRVVLLAERDRFHCPAEVAYRSGWYPVNRWGNEAGTWRRELTRYRITHLFVRDEAYDRVSLVQALRDRLELVERRGRATLYRVRPEATNASEPPGLPGREKS